MTAAGPACGRRRSRPRSCGARRRSTRWCGCCPAGPRTLTGPCRRARSRPGRDGVAWWRSAEGSTGPGRRWARENADHVVPVVGSESRLAAKRTTWPPGTRCRCPRVRGCQPLALGRHQLQPHRGTPGYQNSISFWVRSPGATSQARSGRPPRDGPGGVDAVVVGIGGGDADRRFGAWVSRRSMPCSTSVDPSWGPPLVPRLTLTEHGVDPASWKTKASASRSWTESPKLHPDHLRAAPRDVAVGDVDEDQPCLGGHTGNPGAQPPLPAAMSITWVPWAGSAGSSQ